MFLDELRYSHYAYARILDPSTYARSAILNIDRPLDKVLHSIVVAVEILLFIMGTSLDDHSRRRKTKKVGPTMTAAPPSS